MVRKKRQREKIIAFVGPMNARKTLLLIDHILASEAVNLQVDVFKPAIDNRYPENIIRSGAGGEHQAIPVANSKQILDHIFCTPNRPLPDLVAIDEAQFFDENIGKVITYLSEHGIEVAFSGLNMDFKGEAFPSMKDLMPLATRIELLTARCTYCHKDGRSCGAPATMTHRLIDGKPAPYNSPLVVIESTSPSKITYEARCLNHWTVPGKPKIEMCLDSDAHCLDDHCTISRAI
ncbi:MAG: thymidine kinase [Candidatus Shapirobacteria bacterium]|nr:thymidine kinase [Candidatus Shapirobacteria bacterium]